MQRHVNGINRFHLPVVHTVPEQVVLAACTSRPLLWWCNTRGVTLIFVGTFVGTSKIRMKKHQ